MCAVWPYVVLRPRCSAGKVRATKLCRQPEGKSKMQSRWRTKLRMISNLLLGFIATAAFFVASAHAGDWPQILGPHRDGRAEGESLADSWPAGGPKVLWERPVGRGYADRKSVV